MLLVEDGNHGEYRPRPEEFTPEGTAFIRAADLGGGRVLFERAEHINEIALARIRKGVGRPGDVLLSHKGTVGKVAQAALDCEPFVCSPQTTFWRVTDDGVLDRRFLYAYLRSAAFESQLLSRKGETDMADYVSLTAQRHLLVPIPPIGEQQAIAGVLGALDDKIELNRRMNETLEALAQLRFDAPPRSTAVPLGDLLTLSRDGVDPAAEPDQRFEHFSIPAFDDGQAPIIELGAAIKSSKLTVPPGSVLLSKLNPRISRVWLPDLRGLLRPICSTEFLVAVPTARASREFLYCLFRSAAFADEFASRVAGTSGSHQRVRAADALAIRVAVPERADLGGLTATLRPLFERVAANRCESRTLAELRDALLPKLISGELRVRDAEAAAEQVT